MAAINQKSATGLLEIRIPASAIAHTRDKIFKRSEAVTVLDAVKLWPFTVLETIVIPPLLDVAILSASADRSFRISANAAGLSLSAV
jgi:hypothetical protein